MGAWPGSSLYSPFSWFLILHFLFLQIATRLVIRSILQTLGFDWFRVALVDHSASIPTNRDMGVVCLKPVGPAVYTSSIDFFANGRNYEIQCSVDSSYFPYSGLGATIACGLLSFGFDRL
jgi:hypothetical protein